MPPIYNVDRFLPGDARGVVECVRSVYGADYPRACLYDPAAITQLNASGQLTSVVARDTEGSVVAHAALEIFGWAPVAEMGMVMIRPSDRGQGVLERLTTLLYGRAQEIGIKGVVTELSTTDPAPQRLVADEAEMPCGLALAAWPPAGGASRTEEGGVRRSFLTCFRYMKKPTTIVAAVPSRHRMVVRAIYRQIDVDVDFSSGARADGDSCITVIPIREWRSALIRIDAIGMEIEQRLRELVDELVHENECETLYLDLPLSNECVEEACTAAEEVGFFFSGIGPYYFDTGDALRLQYLTSEPHISRLALVGPQAIALGEHVAHEWARVRSRKWAQELRTRRIHAA